MSLLRPGVIKQHKPNQITSTVLSSYALFYYVTEAPLRPAGITVTMLSPTSAAVSWAPPLSDGGSPVLHYILEKRESTSGGSEPQGWEMLTTLPAVVNECELENMAPGKDYEVRICAENKFGQGPYIYMKEPISIKGIKRGK